MKRDRPQTPAVNITPQKTRTRTEVTKPTCNGERRQKKGGALVCQVASRWMEPGAGGRRDRAWHLLPACCLLPCWIKALIPPWTSVSRHAAAAETHHEVHLQANGGQWGNKDATRVERGMHWRSAVGSWAHPPRPNQLCHKPPPQPCSRGAPWPSRWSPPWQSEAPAAAVQAARNTCGGRVWGRGEVGRWAGRETGGHWEACGQPLCRLLQTLQWMWLTPKTRHYNSY